MVFTWSCYVASLIPVDHLLASGQFLYGIFYFSLPLSPFQSIYGVLSSLFFISCTVHLHPFSASLTWQKKVSLLRTWHFTPKCPSNLLLKSQYQVYFWKNDQAHATGVHKHNIMQIHKFDFQRGMVLVQQHG